jgi:hypothetical protein
MRVLKQIRQIMVQSWSRGNSLSSYVTSTIDIYIRVFIAKQLEIAPAILAGKRPQFVLPTLPN